jgi:hypothetical protein
MSRAFHDRIEELAFLNGLLVTNQPTPARLMLMYGRRRVGKTELLKHWRAQTRVPNTYIAFDDEPAQIQRRKLAAQAMAVPMEEAPGFETWSQLWSWLIRLWRDEPHILIMDEVTEASDADRAMLSSLQHAWDSQFKHTKTVICLCGSHVNMMEKLMQHSSPLFGRLTNVWHLQPFRFAVLKEFFPRWSAEERVALYAMVGGIPAYLEWLDPALTLAGNIKSVILDPGRMFLAEPVFLLHDELDRIKTYQAIVKAIGLGRHTLDEISSETLISKTNLTAYLQRLQEIRMVERRLPITVPERMLHTVKRGRYHLSDAYFRFYYAFLNTRQGEQPDPVAILGRIKTQLRSFVGKSGFEALCRTWVQRAGHNGRLPFVPDAVGAHWSRQVEIDVVAINHTRHQLLLGECKWTEDPVSLKIVRELIEEKTPKILADLAADTGRRSSAAQETGTWTVSYCFFSRRGFTPDARARIKSVGGLAIDLSQLDHDLS